MDYKSQLKQKMTDTWERGKVILDRAEAAKRDLTPAEEAEFRKLNEDLDAIGQQIQATTEREANEASVRALFAEIEGRAPGAGGGSSSREFVRASDLLPATVTRGQSFNDHPIVKRSIETSTVQDQAVIGQHGGLANLIRSMSTTSGSAVVPTVWAGSIIDRARNMSAVIQAGAHVVPMEAKVVQIGRLTGDPTAAFRAEQSAITASDPTFDNVTLTATTMNTLVKGSLEWFQDAENSEEVVRNAIAQAMALQLDKVALYGGTNIGGVDLTAATVPTGVLAELNTSAATSVLPSSGPATNGTTQTAGSFWNEILDTVYTPTDYNEQPNALIWNSKAARMYAKAYDTTGQPLQIPSDVSSLRRFVSNQIPSYTQGTMTSVATDVFCGDWSQLLIGQRLGLTVQVLSELYAATGEIGILATWRGDVAVARPRAFSVFRAIKGA